MLFSLAKGGCGRANVIIQMSKKTFYFCARFRDRFNHGAAAAVCLAERFNSGTQARKRGRERERRERERCGEVSWSSFSVRKEHGCKSQHHRQPLAHD